MAVLVMAARAKSPLRCDTFRIERELLWDTGNPLVRPYMPAEPGPTDVVVQTATPIRSLHRV